MIPWQHTLHTTLKKLNWFDWLGLATISSISALMFFAQSTNDSSRWLFLGIMFAFVLTEVYLFTEQVTHEWQTHAGLVFLTILIVALIYFRANTNGVFILFFVLSGQALASLSPHKGYAWIGVWSAIVIFTMVFVWVDDWALGLMLGIGTSCGLIFIGSAMHAQRCAEVASAESRRLLNELQRAHQQLQEYSLNAEQLAVAEERNRLAREMHDTLGHRLTVAAVQLEGAQKLIIRNPERAETMVETVRQQVIDGLSELRQTVATLRAPLDVDMSLPHSLTRLTQNFQEATATPVRLCLPDWLPDLPAERRHAFYRAAQEGLTNIQKHANARNVVIRLENLTPKSLVSEKLNGTPQPSWLKLSVEDDGRGIINDSTQDNDVANNKEGFGLRGLHERAEQLGGKFNLEANTTGGTMLVMELPIHA